MFQSRVSYLIIKSFETRMEPELVPAPKARAGSSCLGGSVLR
jgi:hypothetical protein